MGNRYEKTVGADLRKRDLYDRVSVYVYRNQEAGEACCTLALLDRCTLKPTRSTRYFGLCDPSRNLIRLTTLPCSPEDLEDTLLHEVAHFLALHVHGFKAYDEQGGHGPTWEKVAKAIGCTGKVIGEDAEWIAAADAIREKRARVVAVCADGCGYELKRQRRSSTDWTGYRHRDCPNGRGLLRAVPSQQADPDVREWLENMEAARTSR